MTGRSRTTGAAAALVAGAALAAALVTGCGSDGGRGDGRERPVAGASAPTAPTAPTASTASGVSPERSPSAGSPAGDPSVPVPSRPAVRPKDPSTPPGPKVPRARLTPATGSFTETQKQFLAERVPEGTDPASVLQTGQESCERIARTARHDRAAAISAIRDGEIVDAAAAITHLCPEQKPLLEAAEKGTTG
ncbi:hypothetical protein [Streptomyces sp. URMC 123]|uniref:hypothetical protein n=1 Tax=Streptomyces sp. URMC 123 TaxID=3423403 RepID=UPI003F198287